MPEMTNDARGSLAVAELRGVHKRYGQVDALHGVDLELRPGELVALLGPNGAGKTTAVGILLGQRRPDAGSARLLGRDPALEGVAFTGLQVERASLEEAFLRLTGGTS